MRLMRDLIGRDGAIVGALGIILKLGLWETIAVIGATSSAAPIFAAFSVMGHKTGNQMVQPLRARSPGGIPAELA
jgi:hypothetical protein